MNILDENILESQRQLLLSRRTPVRQIGFDIGRKGLKDTEIITFLLQLRRPTFFTLDSDFYKRALCHAKYSAVHLDVRKHEVAVFVRRLLRHPEFDTAAKRMGKVARAASTGITVWYLHAEGEGSIKWGEQGKGLATQNAGRQNGGRNGGGCVRRAKSALPSGALVAKRWPGSSTGEEASHLRAGTESCVWLDTIWQPVPVMPRQARLDAPEPFSM